MIDRIAPSQRPSSRIAGYQRWRSLLFMHWEVPVATMRSLVPRQLDLDLWDGKAYLGIVPFEMEGIRPWWWPESCSLKFLETNLRTYVVCNGKPGIYFFSLEANSRLAVYGARTGWSLPYYYATASIKKSDEQIEYGSVRPHGGPTHPVRYQVGQELGPSEPGSLEHFLLERYFLFVVRRGRVLAGQVHHTPYPAFEAKITSVNVGLMAAAGFPQTKDLPCFSHYSSGVDVDVFPLVKT